MSPVPFETRLQSLGLRLSPAEIVTLAEQVAELDAAAAAIRGPRPYLEEPSNALRLKPTLAGGQMNPVLAGGQ